MFHDFSSDTFILLLKICLTVLTSSLIGFERQYHAKEAGLRTHILIGVGSTLIVLTSLHLFDIYKETSAQAMDPSRMIAGIITGIGILCAGAIIRDVSSIKGITTAASLWITSAIGISIGVGYYSAAVIVSLIVFLVLSGLRSIDRKIVQKANKKG